MLKDRTKKTNLIVNSLIDLKEDDGKGKGRYFISRFIEPGLAHYKELGDIVITKETLDKFIQSMVGCPVIIDHEDVTDKNVDDLRVGTISKVWFNEIDGWYYCEGVLTDSEAIDLVKNQGWSVSCSYSFVSDDTQKTYHGKPIDMVFTDGEFLHLAIVEDPRYEGANIVVNKKDDEKGKWITVRGTHIFIPDGKSVDEMIEKKFRGTERDEAKKNVDLLEQMHKSKEDYANLEGKYSKEDVDFDEEQAKKDIEMVKKFGHEDIDSIADYLGLDPDEVIAITGEGYEDESPKDKLKGKHAEEDADFDEEQAFKTAEGITKMSRDKLVGWALHGSKSDYKQWWSQYDAIERLTRSAGDKEKQMAIKAKGMMDEAFEMARDEHEDYLRQDEDDEKEIQRQLKEFDKYRQKPKGKANNSIGDITMTVLNDLTDFIKKVVKNEKEDEMKEVKNEDKRKLIDEVGGILKDKVDEELWRTVVGKLEKIAYEPSEDSKTDNEDDEEDKKEAKNKCKNEDDKKKEEKEEKVEDEEDEDEDVTENEEDEDKKDKKEVKNSMKKLIMGGAQHNEEKLYISRKERLEEGNKY